MFINISSKLAKILESLPSKIKFKFIFLLCKFFWYRKYVPAVHRIEIKKYLDILNRDGIVVLENHLPKNDISKFYNPLNQLMHNLKNNDSSNKYKFFKYSNYGVYRLLNCDEIFPDTKIFFNNKLIHQIASSYVSKNISFYQMQAELRSGVGLQSNSDTPHFDDWRHRFKVFVYLEDITLDNAPLIYYIGTHKNGKWNSDKKFEYFKNGKKGTYGHYTPYEVDNMKKDFNLSALPITGKAGTVILFDARGIHSGTVLRKGQRLTLSSYIDVRGV